MKIDFNQLTVTPVKKVLLRASLKICDQKGFR